VLLLSSITSLAVILIRIRRMTCYVAPVCSFVISGDIYWIGGYWRGWECAICVWSACLWHRQRSCHIALEWEISCHTWSAGVLLFSLLWLTVGSVCKEITVSACFDLNEICCCEWIFFSCSCGVKTFWLLHLILGSCRCSHFAMKCTGSFTLSLSLLSLSLSLSKYYAMWRECFQFGFIKAWLEHMITVVTNCVLWKNS